MKKIIWSIVVVIVLLLIYWILGYFELVPMYHCDTAMGPNGAVKFCEWYKGSRIY